MNTNQPKQGIETRARSKQTNPRQASRTQEASKQTRSKPETKETQQPKQGINIKLQAIKPDASKQKAGNKQTNQKQARNKGKTATKARRDRKNGNGFKAGT